MLSARAIDFSSEPQLPRQSPGKDYNSIGQSKDVNYHRQDANSMNGRNNPTANFLIQQTDASLRSFKDMSTYDGGFNSSAIWQNEAGGGTLDIYGWTGPHIINGKWATNLLLDCAKAISEKETSRVQHLLWVLNELGSPYGDCQQRIASSFLQALFCRLAGTGPRSHHILSAALERSSCFDSTRKMLLKFQEASPWTTFGHVAANGAILEAFDHEMKVHILDLSNTFCTQWPTLLEALATRPEGAPHLRLTTVIATAEGSAMKVMKEIGVRLEKFARLMGVPFEFNVIQELRLDNLQESNLDLRTDEALAVNCIQSLHHLSEKESNDESSSRDEIFNMFYNMNPKIVTVVEDEVDMLPKDFMARFCEVLHFYSLFLESLEESFLRTSNERLMLERAAARSLVNVLACEEADNSERREKSYQWGQRLQTSGFAPISFSQDVVDDVRALLKRYKEGWGLRNSDNCCLFLTWKEESVSFASAWKLPPPLSSSSS